MRRGEQEVVGEERTQRDHDGQVADDLRKLRKDDEIHVPSSMKVPSLIRASRQVPACSAEVIFVKVTPFGGRVTCALPCARS